MRGKSIKNVKKKEKVNVFNSCFYWVGLDILKKNLDITKKNVLFYITLYQTKILFFEQSFIK